MTQTPKQWATTGFIIGIASGLAAAAMMFFLMRTDTASAATGGAPPSTRPAAAASLLAGTIELEPSAAGKVSLPTVVFVIARAEGLQTHGHPLLAKRIDVRAFPVTFALSAEDSMMGQPPPKRVSIEARVDRDGDATTREPGAPIATLDSVAIGTTNLKLVLKPKS
jgi:hypothetical protein